MDELEMEKYLEANKINGEKIISSSNSIPESTNNYHRSGRSQELRKYLELQ